MAPLKPKQSSNYQKPIVKTVVVRQNEDADPTAPYDTSHVGSACCEGPVTTSGIGFACMLCGKEVGWFPAGTIPEPHYNAIELLKYKLTLSGPNGLIHEVAFAVRLKGEGNHAQAAMFNINDLLRLAETDALETAETKRCERAGIRTDYYGHCTDCNSPFNARYTETHGSCCMCPQEGEAGVRECIRCAIFLESDEALETGICADCWTQADDEDGEN